MSELREDLRAGLVYGLIGNSEFFHIVREGSFPPRFMCGRGKVQLDHLVDWYPGSDQMCNNCVRLANAEKEHDQARA